MGPHGSLLRGSLALLICGWLVTFAGRPLRAAEPLLDLTHAVVLAPADLAGPAAKAPLMLVEEVGRRTLARWTRAGGWPDEATPVILVGPLEGVRRLAGERGVRLPAELKPTAREGYHIGVTSRGESPVVWVAGDDPRGVLFGVGHLLRTLRIGRDRVALPRGFAAESAPRTPLRGMQLGYRPKTNSYDGWTVAMWEQYLRDLIVFGCNAVELIPPRSDDEDDSPHFPLPKLPMMVEMSRLADAYGIDVWAWYPAMDKDYADRGTVEFALREWGEVFRALPRLDVVFVPGGDPGHTQPKLLLALLEEQAASLKTSHPKAQMWVSPQSFIRPWMDEFLDLLKQEPAWLDGVAYGPQMRMDLPAFRNAIPSRYPIRDYPDITHSRHCQYPVPDWDLAFALTEGREVANPRPEQMAQIFRRSRPYTNGFIGYSEGCHDDVNKMLWLALGWDERADVRQVLREYARYFIGTAHEERFAEGLLGLERNWEGPALANAGIEPTLERFRTMEREAEPAAKRNWRFQLALYRAYYDAFLQARLREETGREAEARARLRAARTLGAGRAMDEADAILGRATSDLVTSRRARLAELAEALFQSVDLQLSVAKYQAIAVERGANFDRIDTPLSDAGWLKAQLAAIRRLDDESARLDRIDAVLDRADPGPGGFYDDLGDPENQPHLVRGTGPAEDPAFYTTSLVGFGFRHPGPDPTTPRAWWNHAESLYDAPLVLRYRGLDRSAAYRVRVVYAQERGRKVDLIADDRFEIHGRLVRPFEPLEFEIPAGATADGELTLKWTQEPGGGGSGRGCQVAEVWLLRNPEKR
jgi:hypothetical protein